MPRGGGATTDLNTSSQTSVANSSKIFKPLIASSLALALGVSVASGTATPPSITTETSNNSGFSGITWTLDNNAYKPQQANTDITTLFLSFNNSTSDATSVESNNGYAIKASSSATNLTLTSNTAIKVDSLEMRAGKFLTTANDKTITVDLSGVSGGYALIGNLKAGGASGNTNTGRFGGQGIQGSVTIDGDAGINLTFTQANGGITGDVTNTGPNATNIFTFQENGTSSIGGDVSLRGGGNSNNTFTNINRIIGNVTINSGTNTFTFSGDNTNIDGTININGGINAISGISSLTGNTTITGGITTFIGLTSFDVTRNGSDKKLFNNAGGTVNFGGTETNQKVDNFEATFDINLVNTAISANVVFNNTNNTWNGNIYLQGGNSPSRYSTTNITFNGTGTNKFVGNITAKGTNSGGSPYQNTLTFTAGNNIIEGDLLGSVSEFFNDGKNIVNFQGTGSATIQGDIGASGGINEITFTNSGTQTINGTQKTISATTTAYGGSGRNTISFSNSTNASIAQKILAVDGTNTITFNNGGNITGGVFAEINDGGDMNSGTNTITFKSGTNSISGGITATSRKNTITFESGASSAQISGNITSNGSSYDVAGTNIIKLLATTNTIKNDVVALAKALDTGKSIGTNTLTLSGTTNIIEGSVLAENTDDSLASVVGGVNSITFTQGNSSITQGVRASNGENTITFQGGGTQSIGGEIYAGTTSYGGDGTNTISFDGSTSTISGNINATAGSNTITFAGTGTNTISGNISANGGTNTIEFTAGTTNSITSNTISASDGTSTITSTNGLTLTNNQITASGGSNSISTNSISGTIGYIGASGGNNTIEATSDGDLAITKGIYTYKNGSDRGNRITLANGDLTIGKFDENMAGTYGDTINSSLFAWNGGNSNIITLDKNGAVLSLAGNIYSGGGNENTKNEINFNGASGVLKSSSGDPISASGKTNINATALTIQGNNSDTGTLTTTGGTTTLTFKAGVDGSLNGNITTTGGSTNLVLQDNQTYSITGTLSTSGGGKNNIDLSNKSVTISTDLNLSGSGITGENGNIITIGDSQTLTMNSGSGNINTTGGATYLNFNGASARLSGNVSTSGGVATINFKETNGTLTGGVSTSSSGTTEINITNGKNGSISGAVTNSASTNINIGNGANLTFTDTNGLSNNGSANIVFIGNNSTDGSGAFSGNITTAKTGGVLAKTTISFTDSGTKASTATLLGTLTAQNGGSNEIDIANDLTLKVDNTNALRLDGNTQGSNNIVLKSSATTLELQKNTDATVSHIDTIGGNTTITLDGQSTFTLTSAGIGTYGATTNGATTTINLNADNFKVFSDGASTKGIIYAGGADTSSLGKTIINFKDNETSTLTADIQTDDNGITTLNLGSTSATNATAILNGTISNNGEMNFNVNATTSTLQYNSGLSFSAGTNNINFENTNGATLSWKNTDGTTIQTISTTGGITNINFKNSGTIAGSNGVASINTSGANAVTNINISNNARGTIEGSITLASNGANNVVFEGSNGGLILKENATLTSVSNNGSGNAISLYHDGKTKDSFKTLTIGTQGSKDNGISGNGISFLVYAKGNQDTTQTPATPSQGSKVVATPYADKIVIHSSSNEGASTHHLGVVFEKGTKLDEITYKEGASNNILVATVADSSGVTFNKTEKTILGFTTTNVTFATDITDQNGEDGSGYLSYYVGKAVADEVVVAEQAVTATAFMLNYDLYMANLNSLNKRMGELRENAHSQGVWARVFNGSQSNTQGLGSKSNYTTIQAGYDYAFGFEGANNYLGVALSYALSTSTTSSKAIDSMGQVRGIDSIYSNAVEVAVYNSYVSDSGWYNDSIAKFSYLMSSFDIDNLNTGSTTANNTTNFAFTLGDEVGYKFALGEDKEWGITPQLEATFGYFNQSDFKQTLSDSTAFLDSIAESVLTLRARVGSSFSYDFKRFTQDKGFNASVYVGAFYEYDYVEGGNITMSTDQGIQSNEFSDISSDGRVVMNVGTNMSVKDNTRIYFDFERSFAGKITTDYQVNVGVRYSFGESNGYAPKIEKAEFKAPLKVEGEESKENGESKKENAESGEVIEGKETKGERGENRANTTETSNSQEQNNSAENKTKENTQTEKKSK